MTCRSRLSFRVGPKDQIEVTKLVLLYFEAGSHIAQAGPRLAI